MNEKGHLQLASARVVPLPFPHFAVDRAFSPRLSMMLLEWLTAEAPWRLVETDFYEQYEVCLSAISLPSPLAFLNDDQFLGNLRSNVEKIFGASLQDHVDRTAHKLVPGQRIRIHDDFIPGEETHRILIQLNHRWQDDHGGFLMLFNSPDPTDVHEIFAPLHNSVVGFEISPRSNHAVSTIHGGERYTLVFSFFRANNE